MHNNSRFAPKTRCLTDVETPSTFETWKENLVFNLTIDGSFEEFIQEEFKWGPATTTYRGLTNDDEEIFGPKRTAKQKEAYLQLMLGSIASYAPVISRKFITREALSLNDIWNRLRTHYGFRKSGSLILDLASFTLEVGETYKTLWERLYSFIDDNLMSPNDGIKHLGQEPVGETLSPTLLNITVVLWLRCIHNNLPALVKQRYAAELRNKSLASLREEISESIDSLLLELSGENTIVSRSAYNRNRRQPMHRNTGNQSFNQMFCILCDTANRPANHYLSKCTYLPEADRKYLKTRTRTVEVTEEPADHSTTDRISVGDDAEVRRVDIESSPVLNVQHNGHVIPLTIDTGAMSNIILLSYAKHIGAQIYKTTTTASQADGESNLKIVGEVHLVFKYKQWPLKFNGLVAESLNDKIIAGVPFQASNDIYTRPAHKQIYIGDKEVVSYDGNKIQTVAKSNSSIGIVNILRVPSQVTLFPGDHLSVDIPISLQNSQYIALEPRTESPSLCYEKYSKLWLKPQITQSSQGKVNLCNTSNYPVLLTRHEQVCNARPVINAEETANLLKSDSQPKKGITNSETTDFKNIEVNTNKSLSSDVIDSFRSLHYKYRSVFDSRTIGLYNGASGPFKVVINMGPTLPPQRKGKLPLYNRSTLEELQAVYDELDGTVFVKPEDVGVTAEYLNPSFLLRKKSGKKRLVTAFSEVGQYAKPQPALMSDVNQVMRSIGNWKFLVKTDLTSAYWQMPLSKESMRYCGVVTPFKGVRVYSRGAMGMPGTETALEELLSRVLGVLITEGGVVKMSDDLYVGAETPEALLAIWEKVLFLLQENGLRLCATKTVCCPTSVTILGWEWSNGTIKASPHRISALVASDLPPTVLKLRSYIGSYKFLSKVMRNYSDILSPLEEAVAGKKSSDKISWTESLTNSFRYSQEQLSQAKTITLPRRDDQLQIITDASLSKRGIASTLYIIRQGKPLLAGFFNSKLRPHQINWLPCEYEALCIGASAKYFGQNIINSNHQTVILTDSMPCIQAYEKLCRGQFSSSSRVATFLSTVSRYHVKLAHIKGSHNIVSDYSSRNPIECENLKCQICHFINEMEDSVVREVTMRDLLNTNTTVPFSSRVAWHEMQQSCKHLNRVYAHLKQGTTPSRKATDIKYVKRYLKVAHIARDGLLVVDHQVPLQPKVERIIVPGMFLHGLLTCLHIKLKHPSRSQLKQVFLRAFFALDLDEAIAACTKSCHECTALSDMPNNFIEQSTYTKPNTIASCFASDVVRRNKQFIFIMRENITAYTYARVINNEKHTTLRDAIITACSELKPRYGPVATVRVDPASACRALLNDTILEENSIHLELGREKNVNKNPIAERCIREIHAELNRIQPGGGLISDTVLAQAVSAINSRIRSGGLSSKELWTHRDEFTGDQIPVNDQEMIKRRIKDREKSHLHSAMFKARGKSQPTYPKVAVGDLVYVNSDRVKTKQRERYIIISVEGNLVKIRKFIGNQLRSRIYTVNLGDILTIPVYDCSANNYRADYSDSDSSDGFDEDIVSLHPEQPAISESSEEECEQQPQEALPHPRRSTRNKRPPRYLEEYDTDPYDD